jgi:hypothetical protein
MKKEMLIAIATFFLMSVTALTVVYAIGDKEKVMTISEIEADITGDGVKEVIYLKGIPYQDKDSYLKAIFIEVSASDGKTYKFPLESGSKAAVQLVDLNLDGIKDLFASVQTGGSGGIINNFLYSLKDFTQTNLTVPDPLEVESRFMNGYKAKIKIEETGKSYLFNLKDRKKYYKKLGLYNNGKLNEPTELTINPYSTLIPIHINDDLMGLKGIQRITGIANADTIAIIESYWSYEEGKWKLVNVNVQKEMVQN